ncbi:MAG TPA: endolytic transglycosylase MltG, partial [Longilinea sp.]|nr:endolytic transglycosylase MltG [Longilinea sp.]
MRKRSSGCGYFVVFGFILIVGLILIVAGLVFWYYPQQARAAFGAPDEGLTVIQRFTIPMQMMTHRDELIDPLNPEGSERTFSIPQGEAASTTAFRLEQELFIPNADTFRIFLIYTGLDRGIQAGDYQLSPAMSPMEIAVRLQDATPETVTFTILAGWRLEEIAAALPTSGLDISPDEFLATANAPYSLVLPPGIPTGLSNLEGYLAPGSYEVQREITAPVLIQGFLEQFVSQIPAEWVNAWQAQGLSIEQAVILASIVEREAMVEDEMPMIASVFLNRLNSGMKLDSDPTVQYAVGFNNGQQTWWTNPISYDDLSMDSPYNTYLYT